MRDQRTPKKAKRRRIFTMRRMTLATLVVALAQIALPSASPAVKVVYPTGEAREPEPAPVQQPPQPARPPIEPERSRPTPSTDPVDDAEGRHETPDVRVETVQTFGPNSIAVGVITGTVNVGQSGPELVADADPPPDAEEQAQ